MEKKESMGRTSFQKLSDNLGKDPIPLEDVSPETHTNQGSGKDNAFVVAGPQFALIISAIYATMFLVALVRPAIVLFFKILIPSRTAPSLPPPSLKSHPTSTPSTTSAGTPAPTSSPAARPSSSGAAFSLSTRPRPSTSSVWWSSRSAPQSVALRPTRPPSLSDALSPA